MQRINHVEVIFHIQVFYDERCSSQTRVNFHAALINWKRPEQPVIQARIKIVYLIAEVGGRPAHAEVDSNERKRALMVAPVSSDVFAVHEPHVPVEDERCISRRLDSTARPAAEYLSCAKDAIEVRNGRKLGRGSRKIHMKNMAVAQKIQSESDLATAVLRKHEACVELPVRQPAWLLLEEKYAASLRRRAARNGRGHPFFPTACVG